MRCLHMSKKQTIYSSKVVATYYGTSELNPLPEYSEFCCSHLQHGNVKEMLTPQMFLAHILQTAFPLLTPAVCYGFEHQAEAR